MLRDGLRCVFDPHVFLESLKKILITNSTIRNFAMNFPGASAITVRDYEWYMGFDITQLYADKTWVDVFYEMAWYSSLDVKVTIKSSQHGTCVMMMSQMTIINSTLLTDILYDNFGMIPINVQNPFYTEEWVRNKILHTFESKDVCMLTRLVEDQCLRDVVTKRPLEKLLELSINDNWPEATAVLMRVIHERDEESQEVEKPLRL